MSIRHLFRLALCTVEGDISALSEPWSMGSLALTALSGLISGTLAGGGDCVAYGVAGSNEKAKLTAAINRPGKRGKADRINSPLRDNNIQYISAYARDVCFYVRKSRYAFLILDAISAKLVSLLADRDFQRSDHVDHRRLRQIGVALCLIVLTVRCLLRGERFGCRKGRRANRTYTRSRKAARVKRGLEKFHDLRAFD